MRFFSAPSMGYNSVSICLFQQARASGRGYHVGEIISGRGRGGPHIREHAAELKNTTGEDSVEGTLNVVFKRPLMLVNDNAIKFNNGKCLLWLASLNGISVWLYRWQHVPLHTVGLIAAVPLELEQADVRIVPFVRKFVWGLCWLGRQRWCYTSDVYYFRTREWFVRLGATQKTQRKTHGV